MSLFILLARGTEAQVAGAVTDQTGAAVPDAFVRITDSAGRVQEAKTDTAGAFSFTGISHGTANLSIHKEGFEDWRQAVPAGRARKIAVKLKLLSVSNQLTVTAEAAGVDIDPSANTDATRVDIKNLQTLPVLGRDSVGLLTEFADPVSSGIDGPGIIVDGMEATGERISPGMIQEMKVNNNPYSAEYSRPGRDRIEIRTKTGTDRYHGRFLGLFRDSLFDARNALATSRPDQQRRAFDGTLTGPTHNRSKTTFLLGFEREDDELQSLVYAQTPGGKLRENVPTPENEWAWNGRLYYLLGTRHNLVSGYEYSKESQSADNIGGFNLPELAVRARESEHRIYQSVSSAFTPRLLNELSLRIERDDESRVGINTGRLLIVRGAFSAGGAQIDQREKGWDFRLSQILSWSTANHLVRAGVQIPRLSYTRLANFNNFGGSYTFATLDDYGAGNPLYYSVQEGDGALPFWATNVSSFVQDDWRIRPDLLVTAGLRWDWHNAIADSNNLAPRISIAWSPGRPRKTVIRAGVGVFYDRLNSSTYANSLLLNGARLRQILITNPAWPDPTTGRTLEVQPPNIVRLAPGLRTPYLFQHGVTIEQQVSGFGTVAVAYIGTRGVGLFRSRDANAPLNAESGRPDPLIGVLRMVESASTLKSHVMELTWNGRFSRYFESKATYRLARALNNTGGSNTSGNNADGVEWFPADSRTLSGEWSRADFDSRHSFLLLGTLRFGHWFDLGVAMRAFSGRPYTITTGRDDNGDGRANDRPAGVGRNTQEGPGALLLDVRWSKEMTILEDRLDGGIRFRLSADAFNVLNRANYNEILGNLRSPFFGQAISARPARRIQFGLQLSF